MNRGIIVTVLSAMLLFVPWKSSAEYGYDATVSTNMCTGMQEWSNDDKFVQIYIEGHTSTFPDPWDAYRDEIERLAKAQGTMISKHPSSTTRISPASTPARAYSSGRGIL